MQGSSSTTPSPRRQRILNEGAILLSREGLTGVTLGSLAVRVGMSKSGLFAHFRSKESVQIALLDHVATLARREVLEPALTAPNGLPRFRAFFEAWLGWAARAGLPGGCPLAAAAFELDDLDGPVREHVERMWRESTELLLGILRDAIQQGQLRADSDPEQILWETRGIYLSHHTAHRFARDSTADARAHVAFEAIVGRFLPESAP